MTDLDVIAAALDGMDAAGGDRWATLVTGGEATGCYPCDTCGGFRAKGQPCGSCLAAARASRSASPPEEQGYERRIELQGAVVREVRRMVDANWIPTSTGTIGERLGKALADLTAWKRGSAVPSPSWSDHGNDGGGR